MRRLKWLFLTLQMQQEILGAIAHPLQRPPLDWMIPDPLKPESAFEFLKAIMRNLSFLDPSSDHPITLSQIIPTQSEICKSSHVIFDRPPG